MLQQSDSAVSHMAGAHVLPQIREMHIVKRDSLALTHTNTRAHIDSHSRHECDPRNSEEVITTSTARAGAWRLEAVQQRNRRENSVFLRKARKVRTC